MRLTDRSQDALRLAKSESEAMGHDHVGTRHLLLGLLTEQGGVAASVLRSFGFEVEDVRERARTVRSAPEEPNPGASGPSRITQPAVIAMLSYGQ
jgi:ATP-dependent Clp protease ATP-binding subunit ClpC